MKNLTKLAVVALAILLFSSCVFEYGGNENTDLVTRSWAVITVSNLHDGSTIEVVEILNTDTGIPVDLKGKTVYGETVLSVVGHGFECGIKEPGTYKVTYKVDGKAAKPGTFEKTFYTEKDKVYRITLQIDGLIYFAVYDR